MPGSVPPTDQLGHGVPKADGSIQSARQVAAVLLGFGAYALLVQWPEPRSASAFVLWFILVPALGSRGVPFVEAAGWAFLLLPALAMFVAASVFPRSSVVRQAVPVLAVLLIVLAVVDLPAQLLIGALSTPSAFAVNSIKAVTVLAWVLLFRSFAMQVLGRVPRPVRWLRIACKTVIAAGCLWSVAVSGTVISGAMRIAGADPYCIAVSTGPGDYQAITSILQLRGSHFYSDKVGYKNDSFWWYNGLLLVDRGGQIEYFNWSYHNWRFDRHATRDGRSSFGVGYTVPIEGACTPEPNFLRTILWPWKS